jgi:hypothetical protein
VAAEKAVNFVVFQFFIKEGFPRHGVFLLKQDNKSIIPQKAVKTGGYLIRGRRR